MSISIQNYRTSYSRYADQDNAGNADASTENNRKLKRSDADTIAFSLDALTYLAQQRPGNAATADAVDDKSEISIDQKKTMLSNLQNRLAENGETTAAGAGEDNPLAAALSSLTEQLSGFDAETATDEEVSALFESVADTMDGMRPSGPPPMRIGAGGFPPPMQTDGLKGQTEETLSADDMKAMLAELQEKLDGLSEDEASELPPELAEAMAAVQEELAGFEAETASDEDVSALFDTVAQTLQQSRPEPPPKPEGESGPPPMLQAMGGLMPMFAWGLNAEETESDDTANAATDSTTATAAGRSATTMSSEDMKAIIAELQAKFLSSNASGTVTLSSNLAEALRGVQSAMVSLA